MTGVVTERWAIIGVVLTREHEDNCRKTKLKPYQENVNALFRVVQGRLISSVRPFEPTGMTS